MPPKGKKTKAEEALDFLSNLDNLDEDQPSSAATTAEPVPRASTDSSRAKGKTSVDLSSSPRPDQGRSSTPAPAPAEDEEAQKALAYLEAQIKTKRAPLSAPRAGSRPATPSAGPGAGVGPNATAPVAEASNVPTAPAPAATGGGWGVSSFWSSATSAIQSAQKIADEQYKKVQTQGVQGVAAGGLEGLKGRGVDLDWVRKGAEERLGGLQGYVKNVDLEKLRQDLLNTTSSTLTSILNTVAPPISAHETLELWLSHPMVGYSGVEGVVYRAWTKILEQTESGELIIVWSPESEGQDDGDRAINPVQGWEEGWKRQEEEISGAKSREEQDPKGRASKQLTTVPIFLHLQPLLAELAIPEPPVLMKSSSSTSATSTKHLYFLMTLHDPVHSLRFTTTTQPSPADWLDVEYDNSDWVEERLVEVLRTGVEIIAQDYVATRMGLKPSAVTRPGSPKADAEGDDVKSTKDEVEVKKD